MEEEEVGEEGGSRERRGTRKHTGSQTTEHFARVRLGSQYVTVCPPNARLLAQQNLEREKMDFTV